MERKYTSGPWRVYTGSVNAGPEDGFRPFGGCGCCGSPWMNGDSEEEEMANARLIAAAPDLLGALMKVQDLIRFGQDLNKADEILCAAIAKATGEQE